MYPFVVLQLAPPIPIETPIGPGLAHLVTDYGPEHNRIWTVADDLTGQCWDWPNPKIRFQKNITMGRMSPEKPYSNSTPYQEN
jgi:hypothetical protein